jgi:hypothetical protein
MIEHSESGLVFLPGERFLFRGLTEMSPEALSSDAVVQAGLVTLTQRALGSLRLIVNALDGNPVLQRLFMEYILRTYRDVTVTDLMVDLNQAGADEMEGVVSTIAEALIAEGEAKGRAEGEASGMARGKKQDLTRLLERRFGPLSQPIKERIVKARLDQLDAWIDRVLDAESLEAVFGVG